MENPLSIRLKDRSTVAAENEFNPTRFQLAAILDMGAHPLG
jgi:hypothetical protein